MNTWKRVVRSVTLVTMSALLVNCGSNAQFNVSDGIGTSPKLPEPHTPLIPTVAIAPAKGWPAGAKPTSVPGTQVAAFATGLDHPRWMYVLPNGDVLVAETNGPDRPDDGKGFKNQFVKYFRKIAGGSVPSANRIVLLRDSDGDGTADQRSVLLDKLYSPFGMTLIDSVLYVANSDAVVRFPYVTGSTQITTEGTNVVDLPAGPLNHHWTKNVIASNDGAKLYVAVGSNSNAGENGVDKETDRASIWEVDLKTGNHRVFATGLRNPVGMAWEPASGALWVSVNERDELGGDLVPDYMTAVRDGAFYGFPYSYYGANIDRRVKPRRPDLVAKAIVPDYALGSHTASLGLTSSRGSTLGAQFSSGMFVGQHGSWNRKPLSGYKVIFVPFRDGKPAGAPVDVLTGFVDSDGKALGRPVGVAIDTHGALLVADDVGNTIWRITPTTVSARRGK